jgi:hypothetical protein
MALIRQINATQKEHPRIHDPVECAASIFSHAGQRILQLDTFGSAQRMQKGQLSQSVQFDRIAAEQLLVLIRRAFPDLT